MTTARFHPAARAELREAAAFYEAHLQGLGMAFISEIERVAAFIASRPSAGAPIGNQLRRVSARRFPYTIIYRVSGEEVEIFAVAHQRRRPGYWRSRL